MMTEKMLTKEELEWLEEERKNLRENSAFLDKAIFTVVSAAIAGIFYLNPYLTIGGGVFVTVLFAILALHVGALMLCKFGNQKNVDTKSSTGYDYTVWGGYLDNVRACLFLGILISCGVRVWLI